MNEDSPEIPSPLLRPEVHWSRATGYLKLGMLEQARIELAALPDDLLWGKQKKTMLMEIFQRFEKWDSMQSFAYGLRMEFPQESEWWVADAYATRRCLSIEKAREILVEALDYHYDDAIIHYNLACYACQLGSLSECLDFLKEAVNRNDRYKALALEDEDLKDVRAALQEMGWG